MSNNVIVTCHICNLMVSGIESGPFCGSCGVNWKEPTEERACCINPRELPGAAGGFYRITDERFRNGLIINVCDACTGL